MTLRGQRHDGRSRLRAAFSVVAAVILSGAVASGVGGQEPAATASPTDSPRPETVSPQRPPQTALDIPIDRTTYILGPGDVLDLAMIGDVDQTHLLTIGPEGGVLVPRVGVVSLLGLNIDEAEARIDAAVRRYYRVEEVSLTLANVRTFKVFLVGDVAVGGVVLATSATRVSELVLEGGDAPIPRNIRLTRANGDSLRVDLARFLRTGELAANPVVREGDVLVVPVADRFNEVFGSVAFPGTYEHRPGETLAELLSLVSGGGELPPHAADTIRVTRFVGGGQRQVLEMGRDDAIGAVGASFVLQPFDAVYVPEIGDFMRQSSAVVTGQVANPGAYPIEPDVTTVRDLVAMAGGVLPDASLVNATLRRVRDEREERELQGADIASIVSVPPEYLSPQEQRVARARALGDPNNVVVDLRFLQAADTAGYNQPLQAGDVLNIPRQRNEVVVLGAVGTPGVLEYRAGRGLQDYVQLAGGYSSRADRGGITVLRARSGAEAAPRDVTSIEPGDQIIVPFRRQVTITERLQLAGSLASSVLAVVAAYITIRQAVD